MSEETTVKDEFDQDEFDRVRICCMKLQIYLRCLNLPESDSEEEVEIITPQISSIEVSSESNSSESDKEIPLFKSQIRRQSFQQTLAVKAP